MKTQLYRNLIILVGMLVFLLGVPYVGWAAPPKQEFSNYEELLSKAQSTGSIRVIIGMNISFEPEGDMASQQDVQVQRQEINQAQNTLLQKLSSYNVTYAQKFAYIPYLSLEVNADGLNALASDPDVISIEEDVFVPVSLSSSIPVIGANNAWSMGYEGTGQTVAILDTGVEAGHSFFGGRVVSEACYSQYVPSQGISTLCPNGSTSQVGTGAANPNTSNCLYGSTKLCTHGTHVAGIAAGNGSSFDGVARSANIIAVQVFSRFNNAAYCLPEATPCIRTYTTDQILGLERVYALRNTFNIAAVNLSLGGGNYSGPCDSTHSAMKVAIDTLRSAGIATIAASGNDAYTGGIGAPACISTAISVGATNDSDVVASFSNSASILDLLAPGVSIYSSIPGGYANYQGTSMATPHVTGAWAVLKGASPNATIDDILAIFKGSGKPVTDTRNNLTKPRIKLDAAIKPSNDDFTAAIVAGRNIQNATATTVAGDDPLLPSSCISPSGQKYRTIWYKYTPSSNGNLTVSTLGSNYDTVLAIWTGTRSSLSSRGCNDDIKAGVVQSKLTIPVTSGTTYYIEVASYGPSGGIVHLNASMYSVYLPVVVK